MLLYLIVYVCLFVLFFCKLCIICNKVEFTTNITHVNEIHIFCFYNNIHIFTTTDTKLSQNKYFTKTNTGLSVLRIYGTGVDFGKMYILW